MKVIQVAFDDATYEALEEIAGRSLSYPSTFIVQLVRKELGLPYPYEESPLKENPGLIVRPFATTDEQKQARRSGAARKQLTTDSAAAPEPLTNNSAVTREPLTNNSVPHVNGRDPTHARGKRSRLAAEGETHA
jgi:hypothetical protein